jgi:hypothetical protein
MTKRIIFFGILCLAHSLTCSMAPAARPTSARVITTATTAVRKIINSTTQFLCWAFKKPGSSDTQQSTHQDALCFDLASFLVTQGQFVCDANHRVHRRAHGLGILATIIGYASAAHLSGNSLKATAIALGCGLSTWLTARTFFGHQAQLNIIRQRHDIIMQALQQGDPRTSHEDSYSKALVNLNPMHSLGKALAHICLYHLDTVDRAGFKEMATITQELLQNP